MKDFSITITEMLVEDINIPQVMALSAIAGVGVGAIRSLSDYFVIMRNLKRIREECGQNKDCIEKVDTVIDKIKEKAIKGGIISSSLSGVASGGISGVLSAALRTINQKSQENTKTT